ncbi:hypothetical protein EBZ35_05625, partial [bacterium]|nr:hypothetical protein [bacterium]
MFCDRVAWVIEWEGGAIKESVMGVDQSGVLDKATWGIAFRMWWWQWWRFISYLCLGGIVLGLIGMLRGRSPNSSIVRAPLRWLHGLQAVTTL